MPLLQGHLDRTLTCTSSSHVHGTDPSVYLAHARLQVRASMLLRVRFDDCLMTACMPRPDIRQLTYKVCPPRGPHAVPTVPIKPQLLAVSTSSRAPKHSDGRPLYNWRAAVAQPTARLRSNNDDVHVLLQLGEGQVHIVGMGWRREAQFMAAYTLMVGLLACLLLRLYARLLSRAHSRAD
jgi:hypothetical protein